MSINLELKFILFILILALLLNTLVNINNLLTLVILIIGVICMVRFFIILPIKKIIKKMEDVEKGDMSEEFILDSNDEIGKLAKSFNSMLGNINTSQKGLSKKIEELNVVNKISQAISSTFNLDEILRLIITFSRDTIKAETVSLMLIDPKTNELMIQMAIGINETVMKRRMKIGEGISGWVALNGKPLLIQDIEKDARFKRKSSKKYATKSLLSVPLITKGKVIGVLNVNNKSSNDVFTEDDLNLLTILAGQASTAIENSRLLQVSLLQKNIDQQMKIAHDIQTQLLPKKLPDVKGIDIGVLSISARDIGGDYCDVLDMPQQKKLAIVMGDVSGKGIPAALLMVMVRSYLKTKCATTNSIHETLKDINELIISDNKIYSDTFITLFFGVIDKDSFTLTYSNAGHDPVYLFHRSTRTFETLKTGDLLLGIFPGANFHENKIQLKKGDLLILYTDGIIEAINPKHELFGEERFIRTVFRNIKNKGTHIKDAIYNEVVRFSGSEVLHDDVAILSIDIDYNPEEYESIGDVCNYSVQCPMVITFMDKWFIPIIDKATLKIFEAMKDKNMLPKDANVKNGDIENIFFKRCMGDEVFDESLKILKINLKAILDYVFVIDIINEELAKTLGFDEDAVYEWTVGIKEAVINAISYGTDFDKEEWIGIYYRKEPNKMIVSVRDHGKVLT
ncbi:MAG: SpoIIE family protein phosphatase [Candidatus Firestonebacteria bacterium]|nr:SpoIIE family protein phosphatase [Candidatus Firestonebacteria bacterium]